MSARPKRNVRKRHIDAAVPADLYQRTRLIAARHHQTPGELVADLIDKHIPEQVCRVCGCSHWDPCIDSETEESCAWAPPAFDICTVCAKAQRGARGSSL
ncbi:MAG TPA: hypothetical protein VGG64_08815 [Pirellulales bacterium]|jgi:hypothetical protein